MTCCQETGDYSSVLFEWYKYVALLCAHYCCLRRGSPPFQSIPPLHYSVLTGLLNRCARLMSSNVVLSREGLFGETTAILDRCILESAIKVIWLCTKADDESFARFITSGLKTELELKNDITARISERGGTPLEIEKRMLNSIQNYMNLSGLSEAEIKATKRLPDLASMIQTIGPDPLLYIVGGRVGSEPIHGTWSSLITHYLEEKDGEFKPATRRPTVSPVKNSVVYFISIGYIDHPVLRGHGQEAKRGEAGGHRITRNCAALGLFLLSCAPTELSLIAMWCLIGATPRGQPWTPAVTLPQGCDGLRARRMAVLWTFREPSRCRHVHRELMRKAVLNLTLIIPPTACH